MRRVCLLGASGSIGTQTLEVLKENRASFSLISLSVGNSTSLLDSTISSFPEIRHIYVKNKQDMAYFASKYPSISFYFGDEGLKDLIRNSSPDMVVNALSGFVGLAPSLLTLDLGKILCLANKESLVVGGSLLKESLKKHHGTLYPIDSEHVAIAKCLKVANKKVSKLILTCSGGPFYFKDVDFDKVTPIEALKHPSWKMGRKISIDSSTLMNKGFEIIEASELFSFPVEKIEVVIHPESHLHSAILLEDGTYLGQVSLPDMKGPIEYALKEGKVSYDDIISFKSYSELPYHFYPFDKKEFSAISLAKEAYSLGGAAPCILNAADEVAVSLFLEGKIKYSSIVPLCKIALKEIPNIINPSLDDLIQVNESTIKWIKDRRDD